jgi:putative heme transporter
MTQQPDSPDGAMTDNPDRRLRPVHLVAGIVLAIAVGVALVTGIGRLAGFADLRRAVRGADPGWLAVCVAGQIAVFTGYTGAIRHAIADGGRTWMPAGLVARLVLASFAATQVFAFGGVGGLAIVYWAFRRVGLERDEAAVRMIGLNTAVYLVFGAVGWSAAAWALVSASAPAGMTVPWLIGIPVVLVAARWFTAPDRISRWTAPATTVWRRALGTGVAAAAWVRAALGSRERRPLFAWAACYWVGDIASLWAALRAFGADPPLSAVVVAYTTGYLAQSLPIPLIATGGVDAATTFLLHAVGVPLDVALLGVVTHRVFAFWLPVIPGSVFALSLPSIGRELTDAATAAAAPSAP